MIPNQDMVGSSAGQVMMMCAWERHFTQNFLGEAPQYRPELIYVFTLESDYKIEQSGLFELQCFVKKQDIYSVYMS